MKEYLELREKTVQMKAIESEMESLIEDNPKEDGKVLIDGKPWIGNGGTGQGSLLGLIDSAIFGVEIIIGIIVLLLVASFFTGGKKEESTQGTGEHQIVVNVNTRGVQSTKQPKTETQAKPAEQAKTEMSKKEFSDAMKILRKRFALGEITKEQFNQMKKDLEN